MLLRFTMYGWRGIADGQSLWGTPSKGGVKAKALHQVHLYGVNGSGKSSVLEGIWTLLQVTLGQMDVPHTEGRGVTLEGYFQVDDHKVFLGVGFCDGEIYSQELWVWGPRVKGVKGQTLYSQQGDDDDCWLIPRPDALTVTPRTPMTVHLMTGPPLDGAYGEAQRLLRLLSERVTFPSVSEEDFWKAAIDPQFRAFFRDWMNHMDQDLVICEDGSLRRDLPHDKSPVQWGRLSKGIKRTCCLGAALYPLRQPGMMVLVDDLCLSLDYETLQRIAQGTPKESQLVLTANNPSMIRCIAPEQINGLCTRQELGTRIESAHEYIKMSNRRALEAVLQGRLWGHGGSLTYEDTPPWWRPQTPPDGEVG